MTGRGRDSSEVHPAGGVAQGDLLTEDASDGFGSGRDEIHFAEASLDPAADAVTEGSGAGVEAADSDLSEGTSDPDFGTEEAIAPEASAMTDDVTRLLARAEVFQDDGRLESALEEARCAVDLDPARRDGRLRLGSILTELGRFDAAEEEIRTVLREVPEDPDAHLCSGILLFRRGLYADASDAFRAVVTRRPADVQAHYCRGEALNRIGRVEDALNALRHVIELDPEHTRAYRTLGMLHDRQGRPEEAAAMYRKMRESAER
ncbi:MAG: tetratricopeptide repeat protein [Longimicrobiales bacterium]|nr:tetratricopeptide repeat protein [Longimicrobiales bacterium]